MIGQMSEEETESNLTGQTIRFPKLAPSASAVFGECYITVAFIQPKHMRFYVESKVKYVFKYIS